MTQAYENIGREAKRAEYRLARSTVFSPALSGDPRRSCRLPKRSSRRGSIEGVQDFTVTQEKVNENKTYRSKVSMRDERV